MDKVDFGEIGRNIKIQRTRKGLRQSELAELTGVWAAHISHVENGQTKLSTDLLICIANALEIDISALCGKNLNASMGAVMSRQIAEELDGAPQDLTEFVLEVSRSSRKLYEKARKLSD